MHLCRGLLFGFKCVPSIACWSQPPVSATRFLATCCTTGCRSPIFEGLVPPLWLWPVDDEVDMAQRFGKAQQLLVEYKTDVLDAQARHLFTITINIESRTSDKTHRTSLSSELSQFSHTKHNLPFKMLQIIITLLAFASVTFATVMPIGYCSNQQQIIPPAPPLSTTVSLSWTQASPRATPPIPRQVLLALVHLQANVRRGETWCFAKWRSN